MLFIFRQVKPISYKLIMINEGVKDSRKWFAWANTLFGELQRNTYKENPRLLFISFRGKCQCLQKINVFVA